MSANADIRPRARDLGIAIGPYNPGHHRHDRRGRRQSRPRHLNRRRTSAGNDAKPL